MVELSTMEMKNSSSFSCASSSLEEVSVSFGRFEGDCSASWEKWSSFSPNKYLEEVEKCSTPGSVAQKKAYFEAHYNKPIVAAAAAASNQDQQQTDTDDSPAVPQEMDDLELSNNNDHGKIIMTEVVTDPVFDVKIQNCEILLQENIHLTESLEKEVTADASEKPQKVEIKKKPQKVEIKKKPQKVVIKKKSPLPLLTKSIKSTSTTTTVVASSSSAKVVTSMGKSISPTTDRKTNYAPNSSSASSSLHNNMSMSLLLGHDATTTRKSLIMEKMGDKDIVKRAFRTFQNNFNQSIRSAVDVADEKNKSTQRKQLSISSTSQTQTKLNQNDSTRKKTTTPKPLVKVDIQGSQPGSSKVTKSPGLPKASALDQRKAKPAPSPGLRNDEKEDRAETLKEKKKLEDKSAKLKGKTDLSTIPKGKGGKAQVIGQPKPMSKVIYQEGKTTTKGGLLEMEGAKNEKHRQPELRV